MWKWLALPGTKKKEENHTEGVYKEPAKASFKDSEFVKKVDTLIDSLNMPVSSYVPDFTALEPSVMRTTDKWKQQAYKKALIDFLENYRKGWFSVCVVHAVADAFEVDYYDSYRLKEIHKKLGLIHCVHWKNMDPEIMEELPSLLNEFFRLIERLAYPEEYREGNTYEGESFYHNGNVYSIENGQLREKRQ